jgi:hypothetical protein
MKGYLACLRKQQTQKPNQLFISFCKLQGRY